MYTREQILDKVKDIIVSHNYCDRDEVSLTTTLEDDLGLDSLDRIELSMELERELGISLNDETISQAKQVSHIVDHVEEVQRQLESASKN